MDRQKRREKESRKGGVYASSSSKDRERDEQRNRDRDRHRGKNSSKMLVVGLLYDNGVNKKFMNH